ncbi:MAG: hypothetical protein LBK71_06200 [Verrucomicrobiales bacterium]|nr:hypothetical protein [Verrucomicrobiales bacterium]
MKSIPRPINLDHLRPGKHVWVKKIHYHHWRPVPPGYEVKGYVINSELLPQVLYVAYYWRRRDTVADSEELTSIFRTSTIIGHTGHVIHTLNSDYEVHDLGEPTDKPKLPALLKQLWLQQYGN